MGGADTSMSPWQRSPSADDHDAREYRPDYVFEGGAFELLRDLLVRLRRPDGPFDATVLLVADWDTKTRRLRSVNDPAPALSLPRFFEDLLGALMANTPVGVYQGVRARKLGEPEGGFPPSEDPETDRI